MELTLPLVVLSAIVTVVVMRLVISAFKFWRFLSIVLKTPGPSLLHLVRNSIKWTYDTLTPMREICHKYHFKPWRAFLPTDVLYVVSSPEDIAGVIMNSQLTEKSTFYYSGMNKFLGDGNLITLNGNKYNVHRRFIAPGFHKNALASYIHLFNEGAQNFVTKIRQVPPGTQFKQAVNQLTDIVFSSTAKILGGEDFHTRIPNTLSTDVHKCEYFVHILSLNPFTILSEFLSYRKIKAKRRELVSDYGRQTLKIKEQTQENFRKNKSSFKSRSFIDNIINKQDSYIESLPISNEDFVTEMFTVIIFGTASTSQVTFLTLCMLSLYPETQDTVRQELQSIFGESERPVENDDLKKMVQLESVIKETLRLYPTAPMVGRTTRQDTEINGTVFPKGAVVGVSIANLHRNPNVYENPNEFDSTRFLPENAGKIPPSAYLPFGFGGRTCIGSQFGMSAIKVYLATVLRNFQVRPGENFKCKEDIHVKQFLTLHIENEPALRFIPLLS